MAIEVKIESLELIQPSSPTPQHLKHHKFSFLDQTQLSSHIPLIFFYQNQASSPNSTDQTHVFQQLKQSLSDRLAKFYPLAGRVNANSSIECNDAGALLVKAQVQDCLSKAISQSTTDEELDKYLPIKAYGAREEKVLVILLGVQITFFECGGLVIGMSMSHKAGDLNSMVTFMNSWAAIYRGEFCNLQPNFDFGLQHFPPVTTFATPELPRTGEMAEFGRKENLVVKHFWFDKEKLAELKALASAASEMKDPTRVEVVSAFISKMLIEIGRAKDPPKRMFSITEVVNLRPRMKQLPVDEFFFGNLSSISVSDFFKSEIEFHNLASSVRAVTRTFNHQSDENLRDKVIAETDKINKITTGKLVFNPEAEYCMLTSFCRFPLYEVDFGWGKPLLVRHQVMPFKNVVYLMDTRGGDGVEAWIAMMQEDAAMLPKEFLSLTKS